MKTLSVFLKGTEPMFSVDISSISKKARVALGYYFLHRALYAEDQLPELSAANGLLLICPIGVELRTREAATVISDLQQGFDHVQALFAEKHENQEVCFVFSSVGQWLESFEKHKGKQKRLQISSDSFLRNGLYRALWDQAAGLSLLSHYLPQVSSIELPGVLLDTQLTTADLRSGEIGPRTAAEHFEQGRPLFQSFHTAIIEQYNEPDEELESPDSADGCSNNTLFCVALSSVAQELLIPGYSFVDTLAQAQFYRGSGGI